MFYSFSCIYIWSCCTLKIKLMLNYLHLSEGSATLMAMFWYLSMPIKTNCGDGALHGTSRRCISCPRIKVSACLGFGSHLCVSVLPGWLNLLVAFRCGGSNGGAAARASGGALPEVRQLLWLETAKNAAAPGPWFENPILSQSLMLKSHE